jgi:hypothetical protein
VIQRHPTRLAVPVLIFVSLTVQLAGCVACENISPVPPPRADSGHCPDPSCVDSGHLIATCLDRAATCTADPQCCSGYCDGSACAGRPGAPACRSLGESCGSAADCCSTVCADGRCAPQAACRAFGDRCASDLECCSFRCDGAGEFGWCAAGLCRHEGEPCGASTECCTMHCATGADGTSTCAASGGCRLTFSACQDAQQCCGGGDNPNGAVQCVPEAGAAGASCGSGMACIPVGAVCGESSRAPDGGFQDVWFCCDRSTAVCQMDLGGLRRCMGGVSQQCPSGFTGDAGCCLAEDQLCQLRDQCCDRRFCLPDEAGTLRCAQPACVGLGGACAPTGDASCCLGECASADGTTGICALPAPPGCGAAASPCSVAADCCDGACEGGSCAPCRATGEPCEANASCCTRLCEAGACAAPNACQPAGGICTGTGDCCPGTRCSPRPGSVWGACESSGCTGRGQLCIGSAECCPGLGCAARDGSACGPTGPCACVPP